MDPHSRKSSQVSTNSSPSSQSRSNIASSSPSYAQSTKSLKSKYPPKTPPKQPTPSKVRSFSPGREKFESKTLTTSQRTSSSSSRNGSGVLPLTALGMRSRNNSEKRKNRDITQVLTFAGWMTGSWIAFTRSSHNF